MMKQLYKMIVAQSTKVFFMGSLVATAMFSSCTADEEILDKNGKIDLNKFSPITYDPVHHTYRKLGDVVGKAFCDGMKLK